MKKLFAKSAGKIRIFQQGDRSFGISPHHIVILDQKIRGFPMSRRAHEQCAREDNEG
jgi:hypothetical protein